MRQAIKAVYSGQRHVPPMVAETIAAHLNEPNLTARELELLQLVPEGNQTKKSPTSSLSGQTRPRSTCGT
jgi:DNA-binding NarL/FixJ family response regulator